MDNFSEILQKRSHFRFLSELRQFLCYRVDVKQKKLLKIKLQLRTSHRIVTLNPEVRKLLKIVIYNN